MPSGSAASEGSEKAMKTRIITALIGMPIIVAVVLSAPLWASGLMLGVLCAIAALELMRAVEPGLQKRRAFWPMLSAFVMPLWLSIRGSGASLYTLGYYLFFTFSVELIYSFRKEQRMDLGLFLSGLVGGMIMPMLLTAIIRIGLYDGSCRANMLLPFIIAFSCDAGAFFCGHAFGKHKMAPRLSPNKTREGGVGGILCAVLGACGYGFVMSRIGYSARFGLLVVYGFLGGIACELGDLAFSAIKRIVGIKDYGYIIPGHGGVLDRFDSMYFTAPLIEILSFWFPAVVMNSALS